LGKAKATWTKYYGVGQAIPLVASYLPNSKLITEAWKFIDIKPITEQGLLLEEIEEPGVG
jgi:hypothetical protein